MLRIGVAYKHRTGIDTNRRRTPRDRHAGIIGRRVDRCIKASLKFFILFRLLPKRVEMIFRRGGGFVNPLMQTAKILAFGLVLLAIPAFAQAEDRWALVLSVGEYSEESIPDLANTVNDGRTMASALNQMGFKVYYAENSDKISFERTVETIVAEQSGSSLGLFYFAGHGLQVGGSNYALPADISLRDSDFLERRAISIGDVISRLADTKVENLVVVLDACRNSPFTDTGAIGTGLALVDAPDNTIIAYSTAPGELALDGSGANSPYTAALASALEGQGTDIRDALRLVRARVRLATGGAQTPWFIDNSKGKMEIAPSRSADGIGAMPILEANQITLESTAWWTIAQSADPRDFETYLELFPDAPQAEGAQRQLSIVGGAPEFPLMDLNLPMSNPEVPGGLNSLITACDVLASDGEGGHSLVEAVPHDLVNVRAATRACIEAVRNDPENPRLLAQLAWTMFLSERFPEALFYNELAAAKGNPRAYGGISTIHRLGLGVPVDLEKAAEAALKGAVGGSDDMRVLMGIHYREGWGVPQSYNEARRWFELAVLAGRTSAMSALGDLYRRGRLGDEDPARAMVYYRKAAALDQTDAMNNIGMAYMRGQGVETDTRAGIAWLSQASELGNPYAAFHLGRAFMTGWGVDKDPAQALAYFRLSAQRNFLTAYTYIGDALRAMDDPDLAEAMANYIIAREAGLLKDTKKSREEADEARQRLDEIMPLMTAEEIDAGQRTADTWIAQYGLLDFNLVHQ